MIFEGWRAKLGQVDEDDQLHISIITGVDRKEPFSYSVVLGSNPSIHADARWRQFVSVSRICRMHPPDSRNLDTFLSRFERIKRYFLMPGHLVSEAQLAEMLFDLSIRKQAIRVLPAWQLSRNDPDASALNADDDPIIPDDVEVAPVTALLAGRKATN